MPVLLLERLPLPSLGAYAACSILLLGWSLSYAAEETNVEQWRDQLEIPDNFQELPGLQTLQNWLGTRVGDILIFLIHEPLCIWVPKHF